MIKLPYIIISFAFVSSAFAAGHFHDWDDDTICMWVKQKPNHEGYLSEAQNRGLSCGGLVNISTTTNKSDKSENSSQVTSGLGYPDGTLQKQDYSLFYDVGDYFEKLVKHKMYKSAAKLYELKERGYFIKTPTFGGKTPREKYRQEILAVSKGLRSTFEPEVERYIDSLEKSIAEIKNSSILNEKKWSIYKKLLNEKSKHNSKYLPRIIQEAGVSKTRIILSKAISDFESVLRKQAKVAIQNYDFSQEINFFDKYPLKFFKSQQDNLLNSADKNIIKTIKAISVDDALNLIQRYELNNKTSGVYKNLYGVLLDKAAKNGYGNKQPPLNALFLFIKALEGRNVVLKEKLPDDYRISVISLKNDKTPVLGYKESILFDKSTITDSRLAKSPYIITLQSLVTSVSINEIEQKKVNSKQVVSTSKVRNSAYARAEENYQNATIAYNYAVRMYENYVQSERQKAYERSRQREQANLSFDCEASYSDTVTCTRSQQLGFIDLSGAAEEAGSMLGVGLAGGTTREQAYINNIKDAKNSINKALRKLKSTPTHLDKQEYKRYDFYERHYEVTKTSERVIHILNTKQRTYKTIKKPLVEKKNFVFAEGLNEKDAKYSTTQYQNKNDIEIFLNKPKAISIESIVQSQTEDGKLQTFSNLSSLLEEIQSSFDKQAEASAKNYSPFARKEDKDDNKTNKSGESLKLLNQLSEAKELLDLGVITIEEFEAIKKIIIDNL